MADRPEPDAVGGAPHPRHTIALYGQSDAERAFLEAWATGRLHHAWLITGPRGVGKATLAWRIARSLLSDGSDRDSLDVDADSPVARRVAALSEPGLFLLRRAWDDKANRLKTVITVDEVRRLGGFFSLSRPDGGRRVVIVDAVDEMNQNAANALLKVLEEPPRDTVLLLVCHRPRAVLPTIRSRCRVLRCAPLAPDDLARALVAAGVEAGEDAASLAELAGGSVGEAVRLARTDGAALYRELVTLLGSCPMIDWAAALHLASSVAGRAAEERYDAALRLFEIALARVSLRAAGSAPRVEAAPEEARVAARLAPTKTSAQAWADLQGELSARARHARAVNLDPATVILDMVLRANETAARTVGHAP